MSSDPSTNANAEFFSSMLLRPAITAFRNEHPGDPYTSWAFLESLMWLKLGFDAGYVEEIHVSDFVQRYQTELQQAYFVASASGGYQAKNFKKWCDFFDENGRIEHRVLERSATFDASEKALPMFFQSLALQACEIDGEDTRQFFGVLNAGEISSLQQLSAHERQLLEYSMVEVLSLMEAMALRDRPGLLVPVSVSNRELLLKRGRDILTWKLDFTRPQVVRQFSQLAHWMIEDATRSFAIRDVESGRKWIQNAVQEIVSEWAGEPVDLNFGLPPTLGALLNQSVETLPLSVTAYSFLKNMNIENVGDLLDKTETHLRAAGKASEKTVVEIKNVLAGMGLSLAKENIEGLSEEPRRPIRLDEDEGQS
jgi:hypothetical protein